MNSGVVSLDIRAGDNSGVMNQSPVIMKRGIFSMIRWASILKLNVFSKSIRLSGQISSNKSAHGNVIITGFVRIPNVKKNRRRR
ncbi:MAG: hypothetical protein WC799_20325 [Desulfobacteraceae bacterium]